MFTLNCKQYFTSKRRESNDWNASVMITATSATTSSSTSARMNHWIDENSPTFQQGTKTRDNSGTWKHHNHETLKHSYSSI